jgi:acetylornithine deacetylase
MDFFGAIDRQWLTKKTLDLMEVRSETLKEAEFCEYFASELEQLGLEVLRRPVDHSRFNVYGKWKGSTGDRSLILNGHLDTIPIGSAWPPRISDGRVYGRGAEDMKGGLASLLAMIKALNESDSSLSGDLWITAVVGHEDAEAKKDGPIAMCDDINAGILRGDAIVIAEGDESLWIMSTGSSVFKIILRSNLAGTHTNNITFNMNPIKYVAKVIDALERLQDQMEMGLPHHLVGSEKVDVGRISAGDYYNRTPERSVIEGIIRWLPGTSEIDIKNRLEKIIRPIAREGGLEFEIEFHMAREPFEISLDNPVLERASSVGRFALGREIELIGKRVTGDANIFVARTGVPSFYFGPGYETAHSNEESVSIESLVNTTKFYGALVTDYLGEGASAG